MALLPGWDRARLLTADPADVAAARWIVFAQALRPIVERDIEGAIEQLARADMEPRARERQERHARARARESLAGARRHQAEMRALLELDDVDEETS